ncbi:CaiB/BaiF CoA transferase family protein [Brevibacterium aurantiacum]|uniref:CoA transferase n=1 Tax=Brevibacterium aurantiacum TaxID=273384 RepID=A0A4Z0KEQ0_BREAU|nr:CaiB/BaiF CoA-transferase family protein [Brevibacterium aurantiacum]TGD37025.1 CoA transferase [Brevibacterium aurantiacum]
MISQESPGDAVRTGPLSGLRVLELGGFGPGPFAAMLLADMGADVIRVDRAHGARLAGPNYDFRKEVMHRGRRSVAVDLKHQDGPSTILKLAEEADVLIEGFRPGVCERLGIGPNDCMATNPGLVYGRMTGWGQTGPISQEVGHDINYIAASGMLSLIGRRDQPPTPPLSLLGDFGGGGMILALGILSALWERGSSGLGQIVDAAMAEGAALMGTAFFGFAQTGAWTDQRGTNLVDSGAPFYDCYQTADGEWVAVGAMEPQFYAELLDVLSLSQDELPGGQYDQSHWPELKTTFAARFAEHDLAHWKQAAVGRDACLTPVLSLMEAAQSEQAEARDSFSVQNGIVQPNPAPKFSRTHPSQPGPPPGLGEHTRAALASWGITDSVIDELIESGAVRQSAG